MALAASAVAGRAVGARPGPRCPDRGI